MKTRDDGTFLAIKDVRKSYLVKPGFKRIVLANITINVRKGEWIAIQGPSGSGKTTLLNIIYGSVEPDYGTVIIDGVHIRHLKESQLQHFRTTKMGLILQENILLPHLTALENVLFPAYHRGQLSSDDILNRAESLLASMGLDDKIHAYPAELSGGEQQRVAIARALIFNPTLLLADEPTGHLDLESTDVILDLLATLHRQGLTILLVTHSSHVARRANRIVYLQDGRALDHPSSELSRQVE